MPILIALPGIAVLMFFIELPAKTKDIFFKIPVWISSTVIATIIGLISRGVLGSTTGFVSELILWPGLLLIKNHKNIINKIKGLAYDKN